LASRALSASLAPETPPAPLCEATSAATVRSTFSRVNMPPIQPFKEATTTSSLMLTVAGWPMAAQRRRPGGERARRATVVGAAPDRGALHLAAADPAAHQPTQHVVACCHSATPVCLPGRGEPSHRLGPTEDLRLGEVLDRHNRGMRWLTRAHHPIRVRHKSTESPLPTPQYSTYAASSKGHVRRLARRNPAAVVLLRARRDQDDALTLQQPYRTTQEGGTVVHDQATHHEA
jgi:hypothetical protein